MMQYETPKMIVELVEEDSIMYTLETSPTDPDQDESYGGFY